MLNNRAIFETFLSNLNSHLSTSINNEIYQFCHVCECSYTKLFHVLQAVRVCHKRTYLIKKFLCSNNCSNLFLEALDTISRKKSLKIILKLLDGII